MSGVIQKKVSVGAGATTDIFADSAFLYPSRRAVVSMGVNAAAIDVKLTIYSGGRLVLEESDCRVGAVFPDMNTDMVYNFVAEPGERLTLSVRNTTAGALSVYAIAQIQDL